MKCKKPQLKLSMVSDIKHTVQGSAPLITLDNITVRIRDKFILANISWVIRQNQHWAIVGTNGAGKTSLVRAIVGELAVVQGKIVYQGGRSFKDRICYVSFERHQRLIAREEARDESRYFSGKLDDVATVRDFIRAALPASNNPQHQFDSVVAQMNIAHLLNRGIRFLSTGEMRKIMIAQALAKSPRLLILDEPFEGLDVSARAQLTEVVNGLMDDQRQIILVTHRPVLIPPHVSHIVGLREGNILFQGRRQDFLDADQIDRLYRRNVSYERGVPFLKSPVGSPSARVPDVLVEMRNTTVRYKDMVVLNQINWKMKAGENWAISGPNGAGKTTLLSLIAGDNLQAYANEIYLFGTRRGSGESIWEIKERIGIISSEFQIRYRRSIQLLDVVLSGFFDSVGLYRQGTSEQRELAQRWIAFIHMADRADTPFSQLSYGEQRLVLLARAMVKVPLLLILDEPCQGLDRTNRRMILDIIDAISRNHKTHILFVTHHTDEVPTSITHLLEFVAKPGGGYKISIQRR